MRDYNRDSRPNARLRSVLARGLHWCIGGAFLCLLLTTALVLGVLTSPLLIAVAPILTAGLTGFAVALGLLQYLHSAVTEQPQNTPSDTLHNAAIDVAWETDTHGTLTNLGGRFYEHMGAQHGVLVGQHFLNLIDFDGEERDKLIAAMQRGEAQSDVQCVYKGADGHIFYLSLNAVPHFDRHQKLIGYCGIATNITDRVLKERRLKQLAEEDTLTGLANRHCFNQQIERDLSAQGSNKTLTLFAVDLDGFKQVNDTFGHQAGDALINLVGKRLRRHTRGDDWAARLGGDEFMVVSQDIEDPMDACLMAARLIAILAQPYQVGGAEVTITASIGIACAPQHATQTDDLMKFADLALYQAKANGRNRFCLFSETMITAQHTTAQPAP